MRHQYHTCKENKEKIVGKLSTLHRIHHSRPKEFAKTIQTSVQKDARWHSKKPLRLLEQCPRKANQTKYNEMSIHLYSINQFYLIQE